MPAPARWGCARTPSPRRRRRSWPSREICSSGEPDLRGTVGRLLPKTSAYNVIAGEVEMGIDLRAASRAVRDAAAEEIQARLMAICDSRGIDLEFCIVQDLQDTPCDPRLIKLMTERHRSGRRHPLRARQRGRSRRHGLGSLCPVAMLFIRCERGVSHNADEAVASGDVDCGGAAPFVEFVERLATDAGLDTLRETACA